MRWIITDRVTGERKTFQNPGDKKGQQDLKQAIKAFSVLGVRGGCLHDL